MICVVDVSGGIKMSDLDLIREQILTMTGVRLVVTFDSEIRGIWTFKSFQHPDAWKNLRGGGGTSFDSVILWMKNNGYTDVVTLFSDGCFFCGETNKIIHFVEICEGAIVPKWAASSRPLRKF